MLKRAFLLSIWLLFALFLTANSQPQNQNPPRKERSGNAQEDKDNSNGEQKTTVIEKECDPTCAAKDAKEDGNDGHIARLINKASDDPLTIFTGLLAIGTFLLVLVVLCQLRDARKSSERQLRAYIAIKKAARYGGGHTLTPQFSLRFKNCGQTPAKNVTYWIDVEVHEFPFDAALVSSKQRIDGGELPPTMGLSVSPINSDKLASVPAERAGEFSDGKIAFYIFGRLDFDDVFDKQRWLEFRLYYVADCMAHGNLAVDKIKSK